MPRRLRVRGLADQMERRACRRLDAGRASGDFVDGRRRDRPDADRARRRDPLPARRAGHRETVAADLTDPGAEQDACSRVLRQAGRWERLGPAAHLRGRFRPGAGERYLATECGQMAGDGRLLPVRAAGAREVWAEAERPR
ncbi:hypothetical protein [Actinomadura sp. DC4]|uniref:hypothetical protein n=1 Tax=Actinomadura sp. DC4 TaxID=3055069 RepID=UPI0025B03B51|nr:hypothetical protein [Actinomadura sp. DC4]MDN3357522.1 hypothetical protein [Actinomadura sp. DC4]